MPNLSDARLVQRALTHDTESFSALVYRHMPAVSAVALAYSKNLADAEDIAQEAFLKAWKSLDTLRSPQRFGGWVVTIARNIARSHFNRIQHETQSLEAYRRETAMTKDSNGDSNNDALLALLPALITELPASDRELVLLRYQGGRKTREIAALLDLSHAAVRKRLERIRKSLGQALLATLEAAPEQQEKRDQRAKQIASAIIAVPPGWKQAAPIAAATSSISLATALTGVLVVCAIVAIPVALYIQGKDNTVPPESTTSTFTTSEQSDAPVTENLSMAKAEDTPLSTLVVASPPSEAPPGGSIGGRIYEEDTGQGIEKVLLRLHVKGTEEKIDVLTDDQGMYQFEGLAPGAYTVQLRPTDEFRWRYPQVNRMNWTRELVLKKNGRVNNIDFTFIRGLTVRGRVVDPKGKPLADAVIKAWSNSNMVSSETKTDTEGRFSFQGFSTDEPAFFWPHFTGLAMPPHGPVQIPAAGIEDLLLTMHPESILAGQLVDQDGNGLSQVRIMPWPKGVSTLSKEFSATTDLKGNFEMHGLHASSYRFNITFPDETDSRRLPDSENIELAEGEELHDVVLCYVIPGDLTISGRITDDQGKPCKGIHVWASGKSFTRRTSSDGDGNYTLKELSEGLYQVSAARTFMGVPDHKIEVEAGAEDIDFIFPRFGTVLGKVVDAETDTPVTAFEVMDQYGPLNWEAFNNEYGQFRIGRLNPGEMSIFVRAAGYASASSERFTLASGETREEIIVRLEKAGKITGKVYNPDGKPVRDATVGLDDGVTGGGVRSNIDGKFVIDTARPGSWALMASHPKYSSGEVAVTVTAGQEIRADLHLQQGATLTGTVIKHDAPVKDVRIELNQYLEPNVIGYNREVKTDAEGKFSFGGIPMGRLKLHLNPMNGGQGRVIDVPVTFESTDTQHLDVEIYMGAASAVFDVEMDEALAEREGKVWIDLEYAFSNGETDRYYTIAPLGEEPFLEGVRPGKAMLSARYYTAGFSGVLTEIEAHEVILEEGMDNRFTLHFQVMEQQ